MPNMDGTGPTGQNPVRRTGRRLFGRRKSGKRQGGSQECTCTKCAYKEPHTRGIPCTEKKCPKCGAPMTGTFCS